MQQNKKPTCKSDRHIRTQVDKVDEKLEQLKERLFSLLNMAIAAGISRQSSPIISNVEIMWTVLGLIRLFPSLSNRH